MFDIFIQNILNVVFWLDLSDICTWDAECAGSRQTNRWVLYSIRNHCGVKRLCNKQWYNHLMIDARWWWQNTTSKSIKFYGPKNKGSSINFWIFNHENQEYTQHFLLAHPTERATKLCGKSNSFHSFIIYIAVISQNS